MEIFQILDLSESEYEESDEEIWSNGTKGTVYDGERPMRYELRQQNQVQPSHVVK